MGADSKPSYVLGAGIVIPVLCMGFTALRFRVRHKQKANVGTDDWLVLPALVKTHWRLEILVSLDASLDTRERQKLADVFPYATVFSRQLWYLLDYRYTMLLNHDCVRLMLGLGVSLRVMGYPTPPLNDPSRPKTSSNYNIQVISKVGIRQGGIITIQITNTSIRTA